MRDTLVFLIERGGGWVIFRFFDFWLQISFHFDPPPLYENNFRLPQIFQNCPNSSEFALFRGKF